MGSGALALWEAANEPLPTGRCGAAPPIATPTCALRPELCDHEVVTVHQGARAAVDVVFVPEGYDAAHLDAFQADVAALVGGVLDDDASLIGRRPGLFRVSAVRAPSPGNTVVDEDRADTLLGGCLAEDGEDAVTARLVVDREAAAVVARAHVPAATVVVAVVNTGWGRANAPGFVPTTTVDLTPPDRPWTFADGFETTRGSRQGPGLVVLRRDSASSTLDHELAHVLADLGDEYAEVAGCYDPGLAFSSAPGGLLGVPNLSLEPWGHKWRHHVEGAEEGGRQYSSCIYHPPGACRMKDSATDRYCPVCDAAIEARLDGLAGGQDGPPRCAFSIAEDPSRVTSTTTWLWAELVDASPAATAWIVVDDVVVEAIALDGPGEVGEWVLIDDAWAGRSSVTVRAFCEDSQGGLGEAELTVSRGPS